MATISISNNTVRNAVIDALNAVMDNAVRAAVDASRAGRNAGADAVNSIFPGSVQPAATVIADAQADFVAAKTTLAVVLGHAETDAAANFNDRVTLELDSEVM
ncbi:hypothetical protein [Sphingomonas sp. 3-13AW]|jgi:hypothetical protein|uniref:hypothetical protein n=1 Tax=Sphingomonas sp. 3-13AW TaxID=3050450 RepID=UPI003BB75772